MSLLTHLATFQKPTSAAPVTQAITGVGFQPTALILFSAGRTALGSYSTGALFTIGFAIGQNAALTVAAASEHNVSPSNTAHAYYQHALALITQGATLRARAALASFDADGFTLTWDTNDATADYVTYLALAGDTLTDAAVFTKYITDGGIGTVSGLGFTPSALILAAVSDYNSDAPLITGSATLSLGLCDSYLNAACIGLDHYDNAEGESVGSAALPGPILRPHNAATSTRALIWPLAYTTDGFRYYTDQFNTNHHIIGLALAGPTAILTHPTKPPATGDHTLDILPHPLTTRAIIALADAKPKVWPSTAGARLALGAATTDDTAAVAFTTGWTNNAKAYGIHRTDRIASLADNDTGTEETSAETADLDTTPTITFHSTSQYHATLHLLSLHDAPVALAQDTALVFPMWDATTGKTATPNLTVTAERSTDGAAFTPCTNTVTEISDGFYRLVLATADRAGTATLFKFTATGALTQSIQLFNPQ